MTMPPPEIDIAQKLALQNLLKQYLSLDQVRMICYEMGWEFDALTTGNRDALIAELVRFSVLQHRLDEVLTHSRVFYPYVDWEQWRANGGQAAERSAAPQAETKPTNSKPVKSSGSNWTLWMVLLVGVGSVNLFSSKAICNGQVFL